MRVKRKIRKHAKHFCVCVCPKHENMSGCSTKLGCKPGIFVVFSVVFSTCFLGTTPRVKHPIGNENPKWHESGLDTLWGTRARNSHLSNVRSDKHSGGSTAAAGACTPPHHDSTAGAIHYSLPPSTSHTTHYKHTRLLRSHSHHSLRGHPYQQQTRPRQPPHTSTAGAAQG